MTWKSTAVVSGFTIVATWLGLTTAPPVAVPIPTRLAPAAATPRAAQATATRRGPDIQHEAARLRVRLRDESEYREPSRNPFRFVPKPPPVPRGGQVPAIAVPVAPALPPPLPFTLAGIASEKSDEAARSAILSTPTGVLIVKAGDAATDGYRVERVTEEGVELTRTSDGARLDLRLGPGQVQAARP